MRRVDPHEPLAIALEHHFERGEPTRVRCVRSEGFEYEIDTAGFFAPIGELAAIERRAIEESRGRVLDVGAGAGRHALALQERGLDVLAIDVSARCVGLMRRRGIIHCRTLDAFGIGGPDTPTLGPFDTILLLMQSIGIAGTGFGVEVLLGKLGPLLAPGGQILLDSSRLAEDEALEETGGEVEVHFEYAGLRGDPFSWIYLGEEALVAHAATAGLHAEVLEREPEAGAYLARLSPGSC